METGLSRRSFLRRTAVAGLGATLSTRSWAQVPGANSDVRVAVVGLGCGPQNRGLTHLKYLLKVPGVRVTALCDVDSAVLGRTVADLKSKGKSVQAFADYRELLSRGDVDAVSIATPNHWHALMTVWGCQAGKDVYVEKPVSHEIWEGRQMVRAADRYHRVVQAGTQTRSSPAVREAVEWVRAGNLGKIRRVHGVVYRMRESIGLTRGPQPVPSTVDYDLWLGPAPWEAPRRKQFHYDWHWFWHTGNGDIGNQGAHQMDVARWFLGDPGFPEHVLCLGGRLGYVDDGQTPNTQLAAFDFAEAPLIFEVRGLPSRRGARKSDSLQGTNVGVIVECEGGSVVMDRVTRAFDASGKLIRSFSYDGDFLMDHFVNFIDGVRRRRSDDLRGSIAAGHVSTGLCHLANLSYRLGQATPPGELREKISGDRDLAEAYGSLSEHLARNEVDYGATPIRLGLPLHFDRTTETFPGNAGANALVRRQYRAPFVVPDLA